MIIATIRRARKFSTLVAAVAALGASFDATSAFAASITAVGGPTQIELPNGIANVWVWVGGTTRYIGQTTSPPPANCGGRTIPSNSVDTVKTLTAVAQAALLAGKNLTIYYDTCDFGNGPVNYILDLVLVK